MADFIIRVLKWLAAFAVASSLFVIFAFIGIAIIVFALQPKKESVEKNSVLVIDLGMTVTDSPVSENLGQIIGGIVDGDVPRVINLYHFLQMMKEVKKDATISGILLIGKLDSTAYGNSFATLDEMRKAITDLKSENKFVWSYLDGDSIRDIYLKTVADKVIINPYSILGFRGLRAERLFYGGLFEKLGVGVQVVRYGKYKSAGDHLDKREMTPEDRYSLNELLSDLWDKICLDIASDRSMNFDRLQAIANEDLFLSAEDAKTYGLVDELYYNDELIAALIGKVGANGEGSSYKQVTFDRYIKQFKRTSYPVAASPWKDQIGVVYVEGVIVDGPIKPGYAGADEISRHLRTLRMDDNVKAIVLRVNSPGGSASASEKILREIELAVVEKPVVVSMGGYAASGGYWVGCTADEIFAELNTVTGSIGVVGMLPYAEGLLEKLDLNIDGVQTSDHADFFSIGKKRDEADMKLFNDFISHTYDGFLERVAKGRKMTIEQIHELAQGRVWSGVDAQKNGLVDSIGGLGDSISRAAELAGIKRDYETIERPTQETFEEWIGHLLNQSEVKAQKTNTSLIHRIFNDVESDYQTLKQLDDPNSLYAILPYRLTIY